MLLKYVLRGVSSEFRRLAFRSLFYIPCDAIRVQLEVEVQSNLLVNLLSGSEQCLSVLRYKCSIVKWLPLWNNIGWSKGLRFVVDDVASDVEGPYRSDSRIGEVPIHVK